MKAFTIALFCLIVTCVSSEAAKVKQPNCKSYVMATGVYVTVCDKDLKRFKQLHPKTSQLLQLSSNNQLTDVSSSRRHYRYRTAYKHISLHRWRYTKHARVHYRRYQAPQRMVSYDRGTADFSARPHDCYGIQWCGCWLRHQFGMANTALNLAMTWASMGVKSSPEGANVVVWRHHVAKLHSVKAGPRGLMLYITSGNDAGAVRTRWFPASALGGAVAYRKV